MIRDTVSRLLTDIEALTLQAESAKDTEKVRIAWNKFDIFEYVCYRPRRK